MARNNYLKLWKEGLWNNNVVFGQMLALCPLLAVTGTATNGLGMGLVSLMVFVVTNLLVSTLRGMIPPEVRIPAFVLLIATVVTLVDLMMNAWLHELHRVLGLFIPLIVTNCAILGRAEAFAYKNPVLPSLVDGVAMGLGFTLALVTLGASRELLGSGTLFANAHLLLGDVFAVMELTLIPDYDGFLLIILPPGAFIVLGFIIAGKRVLEQRASRLRTRGEGPGCSLDGARGGTACGGVNP
ncbi:electron transport complex subunit E [Aestuariirhabdus litorea]|uniref:Ion-translocating oxidoreductase complex subunit E n=1 Tax=Aestuariirhabdus litorea TaxID=2528527 RepID=A0A3P3VQ27_9GAMM|nr:electron transport complex subunit E [Aestuariirhabdus litorea]RRJ82913.1 electron transport complex subunit E [Aestuariirhabdus litorea]RWW93072.1 RnfABCDGE type electron transport complex subunit E [Endozoicomonadaceae bacterium GTF-13]